ncbi:MAG TPA: DUF1588 domain-containing protein [Polyangiaceae bacterium]|nr:DUF1588 domain-containing protein [Polyangiaceae bacterium]
MLDPDGVLTQASVLSILATPTRTSPVQRGKFVIEEMFSGVLAGIGVAALIAGGALALKGRLDLDEYEETCAPICSEEQADGVRRLYVAGGIVAATGGALVITAGIVWAASDGPSAATTGVRVGFDLPMLVW